MPAQDLQGLRITADVARTIVAHIDEYRQIELPDMQKSIIDLLSQYDDGKIESFDENMVADTVFRIKDVLNVSDVDFLKSVLERKLDADLMSKFVTYFPKMMVKFSSRLRIPS